MLSVKNLIDFVLRLRGIISEPARSEVAHILANEVIEAAVRDTVFHGQWVTQDRLRFMRECELINPEKWVPDSLHVEQTKLAEFCNKWMSVDLFKLRNDPSAEWRPINPEMNSLRVTMIEELKSLALDKSKI